MEKNKAKETKKTSCKRKGSQKLSKKQKRLKTISSLRDQARSDGWEAIVASPIRPLVSIQYSSSGLEPNTGHSPLDCFKLLWSPNIHEKWVQQIRLQVPRNYRALQEDRLVATGWSYLGCHFDFIAEPLATLKDHWQHKDYLPSRDLMLDLHAKRDSIDPYTLASRLSNNYGTYINIGSQVTIDEIVAPSFLDSPAVSVIPRKPHSNGVLVWAAAVKLLDSMPYVIRLVPKTEEYVDWTTDQIVQQLVKGLDLSIKRNFTMDSWFDSKAVRSYLTTSGQYFTLGAHTGRDKPFWDQAKHGLLPNSWKQFTNSSSGLMASVFSDEGVHCCISSAYRPLNRLNQDLDRCPLSEAYKSQFNIVDLFNRNFYKNLIPHKRMTVNKVLFDTCFLVTLLNARALYLNQEGVEELTVKEFALQCRNSIFDM